MKRQRIIGIILTTISIILNQLKLQNDLADFFMGAFLAGGLGLLVSSFIKKNKTV